MRSASNLSTAALVLAALAVGATFLDWAVPAKSAADLYADTLREHAEGTPLDPRRQAELREAYPLQGVDAPFHAVWFILLQVVGAGLVVAGISLAKHPGRRRLAEGLLRAGGAVFAVAFLVAMLDSSSECSAVASARPASTPPWRSRSSPPWPPPSPVRA